MYFLGICDNFYIMNLKKNSIISKVLCEKKKLKYLFDGNNLFFSYNFAINYFLTYFAYSENIDIVNVGQFDVYFSFNLP
jgi:hypothetical protein